MEAELLLSGKMLKKSQQQQYELEHLHEVCLAKKSFIGLSVQAGTTKGDGPWENC